MKGNAMLFPVRTMTHPSRDRKGAEILQTSYVLTVPLPYGRGSDGSWFEFRPKDSRQPSRDFPDKYFHKPVRGAFLHFQSG